MEVAVVEIGERRPTARTLNKEFLLAIRSERQNAWRVSKGVVQRL